MIFFGHSFGMQRSMIESMRMPYASEIWNKPDAHSWAESMRMLAEAPPTLPQALSTLASPKAALRPGLATPFSMWILIHIQVNSACNALRLAQSAVKAHAAATAKNAMQAHEMQRKGSTASSDASALGTSASSASTPWYPSKTTSGGPATVTTHPDHLSPSTQQALIVKLEQLIISLERWRVHWVEGERAGFDSEAYRTAPQRFIFDAVPFVALCTAFMRRTMRVLKSGGNTEGLRPRLNELDNWVALTTCSNPTEHSNESAHDMNIDGGEACTTPDVEENPDESWASKYLQSLRASRAERKGKLSARSSSAPASDSTDASGSAPASAASRRPSIHPLWLIEDLAIAEPARHDSG
ncbi:hypothetical protein IE81DRAFT_256954 [Ceraceosorus guamensis]|uniref:Uncharacterized protein n=1 Tax=Ceraceosorus guamensis TaxID=1522189 RepID=A0A316VQL6_9BASI|nr:hypothetical protein IE81DRAFT_256954 [Ceraceosorus guamensis]PWN39812.1 hypothetical protein IE81DRAFT_256954 [Ceraceosorus guamensis]